METDTPGHQRTSLGGTNDLTAGERGIPMFRESTVTPGGGFLLIPDNAHPELWPADATYFSIRQSKKSLQRPVFMLDRSVVMDLLKDLSDDPSGLFPHTSWTCLIAYGARETSEVGASCGLADRDTFQCAISRNDLRYLLFLHRSLFNLHLKKQCSIFQPAAS